MPSKKCARPDQPLVHRILYGQVAYGNQICISHLYNLDLEYDSDQALPPNLVNSTFPPRAKSKLRNKIVTPKSSQKLQQPPLTPPSTPRDEITASYQILQTDKSLSLTFNQELFNQAEDLVAKTFNALELTVEFAFDEGMTLDFLVAPLSVGGVTKDTVVAVAEYVFLQEFLWLELLAVHLNYRTVGIGKAFLSRIKEIAGKKNKSVLLYALHGTEAFYLKAGFELCTRFEQEHQDNSDKKGAFVIFRTLQSRERELSV